MKKFLRLIFGILLVLGLLLSCKSKTTRENISGSVMLYSSMDEETLKALKKAFETKYPGVTLDYYFSTIDRVNNRLFAENSTRQLNCDVIWAGSQLDFEKYKAEGYLTPYKSKEIGRIHKIFRDKENYYTGARVATVGFGYLDDKGIKIKTYEDLLSENVKGRLIMTNPDRAAIVKLYIAAMMQSKNYGEEYFKKLFANGIEIADNTNECKSKVENGDKIACLSIDYLNVNKNEDDDSTFIFSYPSKDVVFYYTPVGLAKNPLNLENGELLIDYILSKEGQTIIASAGNLSTRKDLKSSINTQKYFSKAMKIDTKDLYENINTYMEMFNNLR